tara:strand:+ start:114562 stop:115098 length:537 start_codon:yes stop_codon:yes gene_type:complete
MIFSQIKITNPDFEIENCRVYHYKNEDSFQLNIFFIEAGINIINNQWKRYSKMVALNFQNSEYMSNSEFDRWNFYIIYILKDSISKELKTQIENDKFSSRKIVEDSYGKEFNPDEANRLIVKHITNTDLKEIVDATEQVSISEYIPKNGELWKLLINEEKVIGDRETQKEIVQKINAL